MTDAGRTAQNADSGRSWLLRVHAHPCDLCDFPGAPCLLGVDCPEPTEPAICRDCARELVPSR